MLRSVALSLWTLLYLITPAEAGTWVGGGGEFLTDSQNPWFLDNVKVVRACVLIDAQNFHLPADKPDVQRDFIEPALAYWKSELVAGQAKQKPGMPILGTQTFEFGPCNDDTQLRFQFGVLTHEQRAEFRAMGQHPKRFASLAVRTKYERMHLKARGFIYIAPDSGELRPIDRNMVEQPWAMAGGARLLKVLAHELGHVYGLPHTPELAFDHRELMGSTFPADLLRRNSQLKTADNPEIPHFFAMADKAGTGSCFDAHSRLSAVTKEFLGITEAPDCLYFKRSGELIRVFGTFTDQTRGEVTYGTIDLTGRERVQSSYQPAISIWLPAQQKVIPATEAGSTLLVAFRSSLQVLSDYQDSSGGISHQVLVTLAPGTLTTVTGISYYGRLIDLLQPQ